MKNILHVSAVCLYDHAGRLLTVRKSGTTKFMHPGGKPEPGESAAQAGSREVAEEVGIEIPAATLELLGIWSGTAANESNTDIVATVFTAPGSWDAASIHPSAEIAELRWLDLAHLKEVHDLAPLLTQYVLPILTGREQHP
ncbi:NUDIX hydrolase [Arthrobacter antibioticus]|uniref:NUDIX hydrolase n=1 Tax=Arthrobacter sp. H35-MC1 TaxID=3046203 RepID=UPI0024BA9D9B|nr:NUDIX domain-containing protein [Arthrobacter sp. H35-MC1]MDJ0317416.1 NUDIX domain-containing protein [Arthrobacter sp. H35-MC1]